MSKHIQLDLVVLSCLCKTVGVVCRLLLPSISKWMKHSVLQTDTRGRYWVWLHTAASLFQSLQYESAQYHRPRPWGFFLALCKWPSWMTSLQRLALFHTQFYRKDSHL